MCWILQFAIRGRRVSGVLTHIENSEPWSLLRFRADHCCNSVLKLLSARMADSTGCFASKGDQLLMEHMFSPDGVQHSLFVRTWVRKRNAAVDCTRFAASRLPCQFRSYRPIT